MASFNPGNNNTAPDESRGDPLQRFAQLAGTEGIKNDERLSGQIGELEDIANRVGEGAAVADATAEAAKQGELGIAQFGRATAGMGLSARQKKAAGRNLGLTRSLNRARASGETRRGFTDRADAAERAGGGFADAIFNQNLDAQGARASASVQAKITAANARAAKKSSTMSTIGSVVGMAAMFFSSEDLKHDHGHEGQLLEKLKKVRVNRWQYKGDDKTHVGPFSEEFNREFGIDTDRPDMINVIDALGVTMGAIKELDKKVSAHGV